MTSAFQSQGVWTEITSAVRASKNRCLVAVAYFGKGASRRLPLPRGSRLVVDASERAVGCGQTCPSDLLRLLNRGVVIYSVANLHAKVFVVGRAAYVGSTNVSSRSANQLVEAVIRTTEPSVVSAAREFVNAQCLHRLTPKLLKQLATLYRPPQVPGDGRHKGQPKETSSRPTLNPVFLAQLKLVDWSEREQRLHDKGLIVAKKRRQHPRSWEMDDFRNTGKCPYKSGDVVIEVTDEGNGRVMVAAPGNVLYVLPPRREGNRMVSFVYLERPVQRRRQVKSFARALGYTQKMFRRNGLIRERTFMEDLLKAWASLT